ncbi:MAG: hypothetical protein LBE06_03805 [Azoarcus sp.]|jgi:hypothetical protein|nr:hypothetical protein [Azoarcus sp.]
MTAEAHALPSRAQVLLVSLRLMQDKLTQGLNESVPDFLEEDEPDYCLEMHVQVPYCIKVMQGSLRKIEKSLEALDEAMSRESEQGVGVARAAGKFEATLDTLLDIYRKIGYWQRECYVDDETALFYLESIYEHALEEIRDWLESFIFALEHPVDNQIVFQTPLTLTAASESETLGYWLEANAPEKESDLCFWGMVCAFAVGIHLGKK